MCTSDIQIDNWNQLNGSTLQLFYACPEQSKRISYTVRKMYVPYDNVQNGAVNGRFCEKFWFGDTGE